MIVCRQKCQIYDFLLVILIVEVLHFEGIYEKYFDPKKEIWHEWEILNSTKKETPLDKYIYLSIWINTHIIHISYYWYHHIILFRIIMISTIYSFGNNVLSCERLFNEREYWMVVAPATDSSTYALEFLSLISSNGPFYHPTWKNMILF